MSPSLAASDLLCPPHSRGEEPQLNIRILPSLPGQPLSLIVHSACFKHVPILAFFAFSMASGALISPYFLKPFPLVLKLLKLGFPLNPLASPHLPLGSVSLINVGIPWGFALSHSCPSVLFPE